MYLSRIELTEAITSLTQLGTLLKDRSYGMHRLLWDLFDNQERFLFREESSREQLGRERSLPLYYVLSKSPPETRSPIFSIETKAFAPVLQEGDRLAFRLRANPTVAKREEGQSKSKRHDVVMNAQKIWLQGSCQERDLPATGKKRELRERLLQHRDFSGEHGRLRLETALDETVAVAGQGWLSNRGSKNGFNVESLQATGYRWHALPEKSRTAGFSSMDYEGVMTVTNPEILKDVLARGLGPSKAFGCGLMLIRRI